MSFVDDQARTLKEKGTSVRQNAHYMKRALENSNLREALRYSSLMLAELRTSDLSPPKYYELYMQVFNELTSLKSFFVDEAKAPSTPDQDLYALVQHAGNVLPRVYLMCTMGSVLIQLKLRSASDLLRDLVEMSKGVQHPTRGLFVRSYLCQITRGILPDCSSEDDGQGSLQDSIDFLLANFVEMNKLWVRMQHQGSPRDRMKREVERQQLQDLVGKNLTYLSDLDGLDFQMYKSVVLPRIMTQIIQCKDPIAQQYLMQCIIQGFPDEFHLGTLNELLSACPELQSGVKVHQIMVSLMDRLARYVQLSEENMAQCTAVGAFAGFQDACSSVMRGVIDLSSAECIEMFVALLGFTQAVHGNDPTLIDDVLSACALALEPHTRGGLRISEPAAERALLSLLQAPIAAAGVLPALKLQAHGALVGLLEDSSRQRFCVGVVEGLLAAGTRVANSEDAGNLFQLLRPLLQDTGDLSADTADPEDLEEEQTLIAQLVHLLRAPDDAPEEQLAIYELALRHFTAGGPKRWSHTTAPLAMGALRLLQKVPAGRGPEALSERVLRFGQQVLQLVRQVRPSVALRLLLGYAHGASECARSMLFAQDYFEQAFELYEESIPDSRSQVVALFEIIGTLNRCYIFPTEERAHLATKAFHYSLCLLRKSDQCRALCACSHLHWQPARLEAGAEATESGKDDADAEPEEPETTAPDKAGIDELQPPVQDPQGVMTCLQRAVRITSQLQQQIQVLARKPDVHPITLYVQILNKYLHYFELNASIINGSKIQTLLDLLAHEGADSPPDAAALLFYRNTLGYIVAQQKKREGHVGMMYAAFKLADAEAA